VLGPVSISLGTLLVELAIFLATVWLMEAFVFNPIRRAWVERDRRIQEGLAASGESRDEAQRARDEVHRILVDARRRAQAEIDEATTAGENERNQLVDQATEEFRRLLEAARGELTAERQRSAGQLRSQIVDIALLAASKVSGQSFNQPEVRELAATVIEREGLR
jgi:F-type H+-transporting ATPase subunit b